jgi:oligopeptidase B
MTKNAVQAHFSSTKPPKIKSEPHVTKVHGVSLQDDYAWMRAANWRDVLQNGKLLPEPVKKHLQAENRYTARVLKNTKDLQAQIVGELKGRIKEDDSSIALPDGAFDYFTKYIEGQEHPIFCRKAHKDIIEEILLDGNAIAKKHKFCDIGAVIQSPDHKTMAWSCDTEGSEFYTIRIRDLKTGKDARGKIEMSDGSIVWAKDCKSFYYVRIDESHRPHSVCRHVIGNKLEDEIIYREKDDTYFVDLKETQSGDYAIINIGGHASSQEWLIDLGTKDLGVKHAQATLISARRNDVLYESEQHEDKLFILTNDKALDFKIATTSLTTPQSAHWVDYIAHKSGVMILSMQVLKNHLIRLELENGTPRIVIHHLSDKQEHSIIFEDEAFDLDLIDGFEFDTNLIYFSFYY